MRGEYDAHASFIMEPKAAGKLRLTDHSIDEVVGVLRPVLPYTHYEERADVTVIYDGIPISLPNVRSDITIPPQLRPNPARYRVGAQDATHRFGLTLSTIGDDQGVAADITCRAAQERQQEAQKQVSDATEAVVKLYAPHLAEAGS